MIDFNGWYAELHILKTGVEIGTHIVWHLPTRLRLGSAIIICNRPDDMVAAFAKRWKHVIRVVERERASTLRPEIREQTSRLIKLLKSTRFAARMPYSSIGPMVWLATPEALGCLPQNCATLYVAVPVSDEQLARWASQPREHGAMLIYREGRPLEDLDELPDSDMGQD